MMPASGSNAQPPHDGSGVRRHGSAADQVPTYSSPWYTATPWMGMGLGTWLGLLRRNHFRVSFRRVFTIMLPNTTATGFNSVAARVQSWIYGRRLARVTVAPPIFVIGHWRSGTTLLHELLALDPQFAVPDTYACFAPQHFLVTGWFVPRLSFLMPSSRPMDGMPMGWHRPQEDEFALCNMGIPSPYLSVAFPNEAPAFPAYLDMETVHGEARARWKRALYSFYQAVTFRSGRPLVIKSPTHTSRIEILLEMFPDARFIHIVRDPAAVFPSTIRLWKTLDEGAGLQDPTYAGLEEEVLSTFERMYRAFDGQRALLREGQLHELRYEDLVRDPVGQMHLLYDSLGLAADDEVGTRVAAYFAGQGDYRPHAYEPDQGVADELRRRWDPFLRRFGYDAAPHHPAGPQADAART